MTKEQHPSAIFIQLMTYCNAECVNCPFEFTYNSIHQNGRMSDQTWEKILNDLIEMDYTGQVGFYLHHEPLLDKSLYSKINDINQKTNAYVVLSTNGQLLSKTNIEKLLESKPQKVHLNINSGDKNEYESSMKGLKYETTIRNCRNFINQANKEIEIEINCPVIKGFNVESLKEIFPDVKVNLDYWANSRGGLLPEFYHQEKGSRFKIGNYCKQPSQNFNILYDGSTIVCCMDWMHESKKDFQNIHDGSILEIFNKIKKLEKKFEQGDYSKYNMCNACSKEMGFYRKDDSSLNILLTNHHLLDFSGSEIYTFTLAQQLIRKGHKVTVYTKYADKIIDLFENIQVEVLTELDKIKLRRFDIAHVHHNIMAIEIRYHFPRLPIVFLSHGVIPFLEQPPIINTNISKFMAVSEEVKENLISQGVDESKIFLIGNIVDDQRFYKTSEINEEPKTALILSNKINSETEKIITAACSELNITTFFVGRRFNEVSPIDLPKIINQADIVFSLGRGVIETMLCGRVPIIFDSDGGDGMVTSDNLSELMKKNFSGRTKNRMFSKEELVLEISKYDKDDAEKISKTAVEMFGISKIDELIKIYNHSIKEFHPQEFDEYSKKIADSIFHSNNVTSRYTKVFHNRSYLRSQKHKDQMRIEIEKKLLEISEDLIGNNQLKEAISILEYILNKINSKSMDASNNLAVIMILENRYDEAEKLLGRIILNDPQNEIALENLQFIENNRHQYSSIES